MNTLNLSMQNLSAYHQALKTLGIKESPGESLGKDGAVEDSKWSGYLANSFIIVDPRQGGHSTPISVPLTSTPPVSAVLPGATPASPVKNVLHYANSLAASSIDYLFTDKWRAATEAILQVEPIIGTVALAGKTGIVSTEFNEYLRAIAHCEFPRLYGMKDEGGNRWGDKNENGKRKSGLTPFQQSLFPATFSGKIIVIYDTPSQLISRLHSIKERERLIQEKPLEYLLDTHFLHTLHNDISNMQELGMPTPNVQNMQNSGFQRGKNKGEGGKEKVGERGAPSLPYLPPQRIFEYSRSTIRFKIGQERIYVFGIDDSRDSIGDFPGSPGKIIGLFSSKEKKEQYFIPDFSFQLHQVDQFEMGRLLRVLMAREYISLSAASIKAKMDKMEQQALRRRGFQLLETNPSQAKRLIRMEVSRMEKYQLLQESAGTQSWLEVNFEEWKSMHEALRNSLRPENMQPQQLLPFVQVQGDNPALEELLSLLQGKPAEENAAEKFPRAEKSEQQSIIAEYLSKTDGSVQEQRVQHCIMELGEHYKEMIHAVAAILFEQGPGKERTIG